MLRTHDENLVEEIGGLGRQYDQDFFKVKSQHHYNQLLHQHQYGQYLFKVWFQQPHVMALTTTMKTIIMIIGIIFVYIVFFDTITMTTITPTLPSLYI